MGAGPAEGCTGVRRAARCLARARPAGFDEPVVRRRVHAESHGGRGRSPAGDAVRGTWRLLRGRLPRRSSVGDSAAGDRAIPSELGAHAGWIKAVVRDLTANRGKSLVIAGDTQPAEVHALAHLINHALGNIGKTVELFPASRRGPGRPDRLACASWPGISRPARSRR